MPSVTGGNTGLVQTVASIRGGTPVINKYTPLGSSLVCPSVVAPVAIAGTLSTRSGDTSGIVSATNHGLTGVETLAIGWYDPTTGDIKCCYGCLQSDGTTVGADTFSFSGGAGDVLPAQDTVVYVATQEEVDNNVTIPGDTDLLILIIRSTQDGWVNLLSDNGTSADIIELATAVASDDAYIWPVGDEATPFTGLVYKVHFYNFGTVAATMGVEALLT